MLQVVWFKRDLRVEDHAPLTRAASCGPVLPLYVVEPELWRQPDMSARHWSFIVDCLRSLDHALQQRGQGLVVHRGDIVSVLGDLHRAWGRFALWSHQETGNGWTFARDRAVAAWCRDHAVPWTECPLHGVQRGLTQRTGWSRAWEAQMAQTISTPPAQLPVVVATPAEHTLDAACAQMPPVAPNREQRGGRAQAEACLHSFLETRGRDYHSSMSSPISAETSCSRLSPHLAWGALSMREVVQATRAARSALDPAQCGGHRRALQSFLGRLHWHCHFIQKLESEPRLEFDNLHSAYDDLRPEGHNPALLEAWQTGRTGLPFVDACMRYLHNTGWLNFRMRAMLVAVSSYHLWLHWRAPALFLARQFTDYEPGIHYSQMQMQSGTTGINTPRIYNPVKQGRDHDPDGQFIRQWVPELAGIPGEAVHEPWTLSAALRRRHGAAEYPDPVVDHLTAARRARQQIWQVRKQAGYREEADAIQERHGSRRSGMRQCGGPSPRKRASEAPATQQAFDWGLES
ncbi:FAD-binding domain-containing protein [Algiphilus sp.]|uniref:FAD-binding domain-containing protein n=1 Tax=Algiphilus sp. TaxID=1872431 RepID=UPI003B517C8E